MFDPEQAKLESRQLCRNVAKIGTNLKNHSIQNESPQIFPTQSNSSVGTPLGNVSENRFFGSLNEKCHFRKTQCSGWSRWPELGEAARKNSVCRKINAKYTMPIHREKTDSDTESGSFFALVQSSLRYRIRSGTEFVLVKNSLRYRIRSALRLLSLFLTALKHVLNIKKYFHI